LPKKTAKRNIRSPGQFVEDKSNPLSPMPLPRSMNFMARLAIKVAMPALVCRMVVPSVRMSISVPERAAKRVDAAGNDLVAERVTRVHGPAFRVTELSACVYWAAGFV
jgi:hypothetical protein